MFDVDRNTAAGGHLSVERVRAFIFVPPDAFVRAGPDDTRVNGREVGLRQWRRRAVRTSVVSFEWRERYPTRIVCAYSLNII